MNLAAKVRDLTENIKIYWNRPPMGRYMTYKEIVSFSGGGIGVYAVITVVSQMILSTGNVLIGNTIGVDPRTMYFLFVVGVLSGFPLTALRANIIDNTRSKKGRYRPFIVRMGIPCVILSIAFVWMPYASMPPYIKYGVILLFNIAFQFFFNFFRDSYENLIYVLSPNSQERTDVVAIKAVTYSLAPSIINPLMPLLAGWLTNGNLNDIRLYRYAYPPIAIIGMLISMVVYFNTHEKIVQAKTHIIQIKFVDAFRAVAKNKYFWILSFAGWLGFLEGAQGQILYWLYQYGGKCSPAQYSLITLIAGNASLWGMVFAPMAIRRYGKKKVLITTNLFNILFIALLYPFIESIWLVLVCVYLNSIVGAFAHVLDPSIQADVRDYQQYVTGERIDGMFAAVGLIGSVVTLGTSSVLPAIYARYGIYSGNGYAVPYDILYEPDVFRNLIRVLILASVCGAVLNVIPYFFYDLKETKQRGIVRALKVRALFEDYGNNALSDEDLVEVIRLVRESREYAASSFVPADKARIAQAKKTGLRSDLRKAKKEYAQALEHNRMVEISGMVIEEMNKFDSMEVRKQVERAKRIYAQGLNGLTDVNKSILKEAKAMPASTEEEREERKAAIKLAKSRLAVKRKINRHYPNGLEEFDDSVFEPLFAREDAVEEDLGSAYEVLFEAQNTKNRAMTKQAKLDIHNLKVTRNEIRREIKVAVNAHSLFRRTTKLYQDAVKLLKQEQNYKHFDEIAAMFDEAKQREEERVRQKDMEQLRAKQAKLDEVKALKQQKELAKGRSSQKKGKKGVREKGDSSDRNG